jgi:hypothetical protein
VQCSAAESGLNPRCVAVVDGSQGLAVEREETGRGGGAFDSAAAAAGYGGLLPPLGTNAVDFSTQDVKGSSKSFPKHEARHVSDHKVQMIRVLPCVICH